MLGFVVLNAIVFGAIGHRHREVQRFKCWIKETSSEANFSAERGFMELFEQHSAVRIEFIGIEVDESFCKQLSEFKKIGSLEFVKCRIQNGAKLLPSIEIESLRFDDCTFKSEMCLGIANRTVPILIFKQPTPIDCVLTPIAKSNGGYIFLSTREKDAEEWLRTNALGFIVRATENGILESRKE